jgi:hypothetical protein
MINHPLMGSLKDVSLEDIISRSNDLQGKLNFALRSGNQALANQVRMVLAGYQEEYQKRMAEAAEKAKTDKMLKDKVNIKK